MCSFASRVKVEFDCKIDRVDKKLIHMFGNVVVGFFGDRLRNFLMFLRLVRLN